MVTVIMLFKGHSFSVDVVEHRVVYARNESSVFGILLLLWNIGTFVFVVVVVYENNNTVLNLLQ